MKNYCCTWQAYFMSVNPFAKAQSPNDYTGKSHPKVSYILTIIVI